MYPLLQDPVGLVRPAVSQYNPPKHGLQSSLSRRPELFDQLPLGQTSGAVVPAQWTQKKAQPN